MPSLPSVRNMELLKSRLEPLLAAISRILEYPIDKQISIDSPTLMKFSRNRHPGTRHFEAGHLMVM